MEEALKWLRSPLADPNTGGLGFGQQACLAFLRRAPMSLQLAVLPTLANLDTARWQTILQWASHDPMTSYALTSTWEAENHRPDQSQTYASQDQSQNTNIVSRTMSSADGSNMLMHEFFSTIFACPSTRAAVTHALLCMRDEFGRQAMAEVLRTVYGYGPGTGADITTAHDAANVC